MFFGIFRMLFGGAPAERRRGTGWWFVLLCGAAALAIGVWAASGAFEGGYPWRQGRVFVAVMLLWAAFIILRTRIDWHPGLPGPISFVVRAFNHLLTLALLFIPGLAVLWYSLEATDSPSLNSRGQDVCSTSASQYCVSGPRALIPWAIILLVFAIVASCFFIWKWTTNGGRTSRIVKPVYDIADSVRRVESVIPPNDPGAAPFREEATDAAQAVTELMGTMMRRGSITSLVNTLSKIAPTTVIDLRQAVANAEAAATGAAPVSGAAVPEPAGTAPAEPLAPTAAAESPATPSAEPATPQEWPPRRAGRELNAFANIPRPDGPAPGQPRRDSKPDSSPVEAEDDAPTDPNEAVHALGELVQMHRAGEITDAEFDTMKARLIGSRPASG